MSSLRELARNISTIADELEEYKASVSTDSAIESKEWLSTLPKQLGQSRLDLIDALGAMRKQVQTTESSLEDLLFGYTDITSLQAIYAWKLPKHVSLTDCTSYGTIAQSCGVQEAIVRRLIRYAMTNGIFTEPKPGYVAHTDISRMLCTNGDMLDALGMTVEELVPASQQLLTAVHQYSQSGEPNETAYNIAHKTDMPMYQFLAQNPERARRFGAGMRHFTRGDHTDLRHLLEAFPWDAYDRENALMVDVGGGQGAVTMKIASATTKMRFVVQDLDQTVAVGKSLLPTELMDRVEFIAHDFFHDQDIWGADIYFFRWIMHNWSDKYCVHMLRSLTPAMKPGAKVLVFEHVLEDVLDTRWSKKSGRYLDLVMLSCCNGMVRTDIEWQSLFRQADARFVFEGIRRIPGTAMSLIEVGWEGVTTIVKPEM